MCTLLNTLYQVSQSISKRKGNFKSALLTRKLMANITGLRKGLLNIYHTNRNPQFFLKSKSSGFYTRSISTNRTEAPTTMGTQQMEDEANPEESAPSMPDPKSCCEEGCQNCVWLEYLYKVKFYYKHEREPIQAALSQIPSGDVRAFVEFELRKKIQKENETL